MKTNCGIYKIINLIPNEVTGICKVYNGSSQNLKSRKYDHFNALKLNKHGNDHLQRACKKDGIENFKFEIIMYIEKKEDKKLLKEELLKWENIELKKYKKETINKMTTSKHKKVINLTTGMVFNSIKEASKYHGLKSSSGIVEVCKGIKPLSGGCQWTYLI